MRRKQLSIQQAPVSVSSEINQTVERLKRGYENARNTFLKLFSRSLLQLTTPSDPQHTTILDELLKKLNQTTVELAEKLSTQNLFHNEFELTKLKLNILRAKFLSSIALSAQAIELCHQSIFHLHTILPHSAFNYVHDLALQQDIVYAIRSIRSFMHSAGEYNHFALFQYNELGFLFAEKCPASIAKLKLYFNFWTTLNKNGIFLIKTLKPVRKVEFNNLHKAVITAQENILAADPDNIEVAIQHAEANFLMLKFSVITHPRTIWQQHLDALQSSIYPETNLGLDEIKKYLVCVDAAFKQLDNSLEYLLAANPLGLLESGERVKDLIVIIDDVKAILEAHILLYHRWVEQHPSLDRELTLRTLSIAEQLLDIREISLCYSPLDADETAPDAMREAINHYRHQLIRNEKEIFAQLSIAAEKAEKFLLSWDEEEKKRMSALKKRSQPSKNSPSSSLLAAKTEQPTNFYLSRAQYFSRNLRTPEAHGMYEKAYTTARKTNDSFRQLVALDGHLFLLGKTLAKRAKTIRDILRMRLKQRQTMPKEKQQELTGLIADIKKEMSELNKLHTFYNSLSRQPDLANDNMIKDDILISRKLIADLLEEINATINDSQLLLQNLCEQLKNRRENFILRLGHGDHALGLQQFRKIGEEKRKKGAEVSNFTREKNNIELLTRDFNSVCITAEKLTSYYYLPHPLKVTLNASLQKLFDAIPERSHCYLVGSNTALLLSDKHNNAHLNPHDIDLVGFQVDEQALIANGFHHSIYHPWLYQKAGIDIIASQCQSLLDDAKMRDFTICAVYIDKNGHGHDPLGTGIDDIANKRLRMIDDPVARLKEDPTRALRAMRYIVAGYHPDEELVNALKTLPAPQENQRDHLKAVARKHLLHIDRKQYVTLLHQYNLLEKLLGVQCKNNIDLALWKLEYRLGIQKPTKAKHTYFFAHTDEHYAGLSREVAANPRLGDYASDMKEVAPERRVAMQALNL